MENAPHNQENSESVDIWRQQRKEAPQHAREMIDAILGFEAMSLDEQIETLDNLMQQLSHDAEGKVINNNRYVVREIGRKWEMLRGQRDAMERLKRIGHVA